MKILIIGSGAREHALAWKVAQLVQVTQVFVAPGNAGTALLPKTENIDIPADKVEELCRFASKNRVVLTIVGPELPLSLGIVDYFQEHQQKCFGPTKAAAKLESSKKFAKEFMQKNAIPTAKFATFYEFEEAGNYVCQQSFPLVIKKDGLAAGKGVTIAADKNTAVETLRKIYRPKKNYFRSEYIVIEEFLTGEELSFIALVDGENVLPLASSQDHKRRDDGDKGPNTGGMGAYSPAPLLTPELNEKIMQRIMLPTVKAMKAAGTPFVGFLYAGLMISPAGDPYVIEFNCRLGDPEAQPILMRLKSNLVNLCLATIDQQLSTLTIDWDPRPAMTVVMASDGYPDAYRKGDVIRGLDKKTADYAVFHAGTKLVDNQAVTNGGRVLSVTALGNSLTEAQQIVYKGVKDITWPGCFFRTDIGHHALFKQKS